MNSSNSRLQKSFFRPLSNLGSGLMLRVFKPFGEGDFIEVDGMLGSVQKSGFLQTKLKSIDGDELAIDNIEFYKNHLHNLSSKNIISLELTLGVCYKSDMSKVKEEILIYLGKNKNILNTPAPKIQVSKIKNEYVELIIKPWCILDDFLELDCTLEDSLKQYLSSKNVTIELDKAEYSDAKMLA